MRKFLVSFAGVATLVVALLVSPVAAAPRQVVIVVAEGLNAQTVDFGNAYIKKAYDPDGALALEKLKATGNPVAAPTDSLSSLRGILKTAASNGFKTGIVTTGDVTKVAPLFYDLPETGDSARAIVDAKFDFIGGGGRGSFVPQGTPGSVRTDATDLGKALTDAGGTPYFDAASTENEAKGKVLVLQSDADLSYPQDRDEENESEFSGLVTQAIDALGADNAPFVLVVHDTLIAKALASKDTPALAEEYHQFDSVVNNILDLRDENPADFVAAVLTTGGQNAVKFTADSDQKRGESIFILSNLPLSYTKAGASLKGADEAKITEFSTETYQGWKVSSADRAAIVAGTLDPEAAIRASYEPALSVGFEAAAQTGGTLYGAGLNTAAGLEPALRPIISAKPGPATIVPDAQ